MGTPAKGFFPDKLTNISKYTAQLATTSTNFEVKDVCGVGGMTQNVASFDLLLTNVLSQPALCYIIYVSNQLSFVLMSCGITEKAKPDAFEYNFFFQEKLK